MEVLREYVRGFRNDSSLTDLAFIQFGVLCVISQAASGRDFLQQCAEMFGQDRARSTFFDALHSNRRKGILAELNAAFVSRCGVKPIDLGADLLLGLPGLKDRAVYAVDGHQLEHACHARKDSKGRYVPGNTLYLLCLHSGLLVNFGAVQGDGKYQREMPVFRARAMDWLAGRAMRELSSPIFVGDPAFVDKQFGTRMVLMRERGALVITRTKQNMLPTVYASYGWDKT